MRSSSWLTLSLFWASAASAATADPVVKPTNGDTGAKTYEKVMIVVDQLRLESKFSPSLFNESSSLQPRDVLLSARQQCLAGYGYCASFGRCCPSSGRCCSYGYCLPSGSACCPSGPCAAGKTCCGQSHCAPLDGECCRDESYCEAGNHCYIVAALGPKPVCCTDSACTAHVLNGVTTSASTRTTTQTFTSSSQPPDPTTAPGPPVTSSVTSSSSGVVTSPLSSSSSPGPTPGPAASNNTPVGAIVGGVVGGIGVLAIAAIAVFLFLRRKSHKANENSAPGPPMTFIPPAVDQGRPPNQPLYRPQPAAPADGRASYYPPADKVPMYYTTPPPVSPHQSYAADPRGSGPTSPGAVSSMSGSGGYVSPPPGYQQAPRPMVYEAPVQTSENHRGQMHELS
ncbi:hypothetical protein VFPBJ_08955 [Purpureocillium lilacinum]|uniref:Uncharacterized protein n=1 Tax=Purpureocillium lilacinum TaxID=33203 RepID=A0A179GFI1_PURLI|nr:hypothetical protein VFPBJ_08955 [Purpureocillium lilacinum]